MGTLFALASGLVFGLGLIAAGMTDPMKVKGFLDLAGAWNPSLGFVMGGAIAVGVVAFAIARRRTTSWSGARIELPTATEIDGRLLFGGALFGTGWGIAGLCPGPALVATGAGSVSALGFSVAMLLGMVIHDRFLIPGPSTRGSSNAA